MNAGINLLLRWDHVPVVAHNPDISSIYRWPYFSSFFLFSFQLKLCYSYNTKVGVRNYQQLCGTHNMMVLTGYSFWYVNRNNFKRMSIKKKDCRTIIACRRTEEKSSTTDVLHILQHHENVLLRRISFLLL